jgi:hypothetical protein
MNRIGLLVCALAIGLAPVAADAGHKREKGPPPWAAAHGYRHKHEQHAFGPRHHDRLYHHFRRGDKRREVRWWVPAHRWTFHEQEAAIIAGVIGGALGGLLSRSAPAAIPPHHIPAGQWTPTVPGGLVPSFSSLGGPATLQARYCREFSKDAWIHGRRQEIYGLACRQPDGSWEVVSVDRR